jgi:hypothetical protein
MLREKPQDGRDYDERALSGKKHASRDKQTELHEGDKLRKRKHHEPAEDDHIL